MEGSESEAIFESLNVNPQEFVKETLNMVYDLLDVSFDSYRQDASILLSINHESPRFDNLTRGIDYIQDEVQNSLDLPLELWEKYCFTTIFAVPEGFTLPITNGPADVDSTHIDALFDQGVEAQLNALREKLSLAERESAELDSELKELEKQSTLSDRCAALVDEAFQLFEQNSMQDVFKGDVELSEVLEDVSIVHTKMEQLKRSRIEDIEHAGAEKIHDPSREIYTKHSDNYLFNSELKDVEEWIAKHKKV